MWAAVCIQDTNCVVLSEAARERQLLRWNWTQRTEHMASKRTKAHAKATPSNAPPVMAKRTPVKPTKRPLTREQLYKKVFVEPERFIGPNEFMPQVNGYGTPIFAAVRSFAGV